MSNKTKKAKSTISKEEFNKWIERCKHGERPRIEDFELASLGIIRLAPPQHGKMAQVENPPAMEKLIQKARYLRQLQQETEGQEAPLDTEDLNLVKEVNEESNRILIYLCLVEPKLNQEEVNELLDNLPADEAQALINKCLSLAGMSRGRMGAENFFGSTPL